MIVGDCGYYALSAEALAKSLSCWGSQSWEPHPDGAFASFRTPHFRSPSLDLDIILSLGTTQLISSPEPKTNLSTQLGDNTSVVYLTADARGWYHGEALKRGKENTFADAREQCYCYSYNIHLNFLINLTVELEYEPFLRRSWATDQWHFNLCNEISPIDIVTQVNRSLLHGVAIDYNDDDLMEVVEVLIEIAAGSTAYLVGLFLGHTASQLEKSGDNPFETAWFQSCKLTELVKQMAEDDDGKPHSKDIILDKVSPFFSYLKPKLERISSIIEGEEIEDLTEHEEFQVLSVLIGNPLPKGSRPPSNFKEFKLAVALHIQDTFLSLLSVAKHPQNITGLLPLGNNFVELYAQFNAKLNHDVLSEVQREHAIDGRIFPLFDCRYVPGFGFNVSQGHTVWTNARHYFCE